MVNLHRRTALTALALAACLCAGLSGCDGCRNKDKPPTVRVKPVAPPAPAGLLAELHIKRPRQVLGEIREAAGGPALLLPRTIGGLLANTLGYPIQSAQMFDEQLPMVAAARQPEGGEMQWAVAVHMRDRKQLLLLLSGGAAPTFGTQAAGEAQCLVRKDSDAGPNHIIGCVLDHYLVISPSLKAAEALAPYTVRALAEREPERKGDILAKLTAAAFAHWLPAQLDKLGGLHDPKQWSKSMRGLVDVEALLGQARGWSQEAGGADFAITLGRKAWTLHGQLHPRNAAAQARWSQRSAASSKQLGRLPDDTLLAASWAQDTPERVAQAKRQGAELAAGEGLDDEDRQALTQALQTLAEGRGERTLLGLRCTGVGLTGFARSQVADRAKLDVALEQLANFSQRASVTEQLDKQLLVLRHKTTRVLNLPHDVGVFRLQPKRPADQPDKPADALSAIDLRYTVTDTQLLAAAGYQSLETLKLMYAPDEERQLASKPTVAAALTQQAPSAWLLAYADPQGIHGCQVGKPGGKFATPMLLTVGPGEGGEGKVAHIQGYFARELVRVLMREAARE